MTKKERVTAAIRGEEVDKIPSGFSLHFPKESAFGDAAVKAHLKFFEESDTDILKIWFPIWARLTMDPITAW